MKTLRNSMISLFLFAVAGVALAEERNVVFDLRSGDPGRMEARLVGDIKYMADYYKSKGMDFNAVVVISGRAFKYFIDDLENSPYREEEGIAELQEKFRPLFQELNDDYGVVFEMCEVGMRDRNIEAESVYSYVNTDKLQAVYLIDWQMKGYAYIPVN